MDLARLLRLRTFLQRPLYSLVVVATLGLGLGLSAAIFSVVDGVLFQPLPFRHPGQLVYLQDWLPDSNPSTLVTTPATFADWRQARSFEGLAAFSLGSRLTLTGEDNTQRLWHAHITPDFFRLLGVPLVRGPGFSQHGAQAAEQVILTHSLWQARFSGDEQIIGKRLETAEGSKVIVGVLPSEFTFPYPLKLVEPRLLSPLLLPDPPQDRQSRFLSVIGRLAEGISLESAREEMAEISRRLSAQHPEMAENQGVAMTPLHDVVTRDSYSKLGLLFLSVVFVLLIAMANVANLSMLAWERRGRELAIRSALGAGSARLSSLVLAEGALFGLAGGLFGLLLLALAFPALLGFLPERMQLVRGVDLDWRVVLFTLGVGVGAGGMSAIIPTLKFAWPLNIRLLRSGLSATSQSRPVRSFLVAAEVCLVFVLLIGAGFSISSLVSLLRTDLGFEPEGALLALVSLPREDYANPDVKGEFYQRLLERISGLGSVEAAGALNTPLLINASRGSEVRIDGRELPVAPEVHYLTPGALGALGLKVIRGGLPAESDLAQSAVLVNETAARLFWEEGEVLGGSIRLDEASPPLPVRGIVRDARLRSLSEPPGPEILVVGRPDWGSTLSVVVRSSQRAEELFPAVSQILHEMDRRVSAEFSTLPQLVAASTAERRLSALLLAVFSSASLALAMVGCYGVTSQAVNQRRRELGIRIALGADPGRIGRLVFRSGAWPVLAGLTAGLLVSRFALHTLSAQFGDSAAPWALIYLVVILVLLLTTLLALALPARRALRLNPVDVLRVE